MRVIVLSGPVASGKSTLAAGLSKRYEHAVLVKTRELILAELPETTVERAALQRAGETLDKSTNGEWVANAIGRFVVERDLPQDVTLIADSCRIETQVGGLRRAFGNRVTHLHLTAPEATLESRYDTRDSGIKELPSYDEVMSDPTEQQIDKLGEIADIVIDTAQSTPNDVLVRAAAHLGLYSRSYERLVDVLVGGQWGSEGKGHLASYLASEYDVLVRVGGPNAGHQVYRDGGAITYYHLPSGTQECSARVIIGPGAVIYVPKLLQEIASSELSAERLIIDPQAMIIEDSDIAEENRTLKDIGSTKQGVGVATARKVLRTAASPLVRLARDMKELRPYIRESRDALDDAFLRGEKVLLEGTQGTGLSLHHGEYPYVTSRETSVSGCLAEAGIAPSRVRRIVMLVRSYPIRVGGEEESGPMGREITWDVVGDRSGNDAQALEESERTSTTKRRRRVAEFNWTLLRRAASLNGPTDVALSFTDYISRENTNARRFEQLTAETIEFIEEIERVVSAHVSLVVTRFKHSQRSIIDRRKWGAR